MRIGALTGLAVAALLAAHMPARATVFTDNEFVTWPQVSWGDTPTPSDVAQVLEDNFFSVYASQSDLFVLGLSGAGKFSATWTSPDNLIAFLPASGTPAKFDANLLDPTSSAAGAFAGEVAALKLNVDFSDAGLLAHPAGVAFGDLELTGFSGTLASLDGLTVRGFLGQVNTLIGGGAESYDIADVDETLSATNSAFAAGLVGDFATAHLEIPAGTQKVPEPAGWPLLLAGGLAAAMLRRRGSA